MILTDKLSTESFHAFIDEQLTDEQYTQIEAQLDEIPEKVEEIQQCQIINERLREVFDPIVEESIPEDLFELGMYGIISEEQDNLDDYSQEYNYEENAMAFTAMEDDIESPLDSMESALDLQDENFIDENEFSDIEALSVEEGLTDFDIDALGKDASNIIPDIFDENAAASSGQTLKSSSAASRQEEKEILDSIESLSLDASEDELTTTNNIPRPEESSLEDHITNQYQTEQTAAEEEIPVTGTESASEQQIENIETSELELQPLDDVNTDGVEETEIAAKTEQVQEQDEIDQDHANKARILSNLEPMEELQLETLEELQNSGVIQLPADSPLLQQEQQPETDATSASQQDNFESPKSRNVLGAGQPGSGRDEPDLDTLDAGEAQSELFSEYQGAHQEPVEPGDVLPQPEQDFLVQQQSSPTSNETAKESAAFEYAIDEPADEMTDGDQAHGKKNDIPEDVVAEFFSGNKKESDFEVNEVVKQFEEVSEEFDHLGNDQFENDNPITEIKYKAHEFLNVINSKFTSIKNKLSSDSSETFPDFNKAPPAYFDKQETSTSNEKDNFEDIPSIDDFLAKDNEPLSPQKSDETFNVSSPIEADRPVDSVPESSSFGFDLGSEEKENTSGLGNKIGDTLKYYKQKMTEMTVVESSESATGIEKYKLQISNTLQGVSQENRMTIGGAILLVIGLLVGGSVFSLTQDTSNIISNEKVEQLAIDAHILYTQQPQNFTGDSPTTIVESLQWFSARIGKQIRLADVQLEGFKHEKAILLPTMANYASANIFANSGNQKMTLLVASNVDGDPDSAMVCRIPANIDGLCSWTKDSVRYIVVANLSLSRVRGFSQALIEKL